MLHVQKKYLLIVSGILWSGVGIFLNTLALRWLGDINPNYTIALVVGGYIFGIIIALFGFSKVMRKNTKRILALPELSSIFAFQAWHSYVLIVVMMSMGIFIRHSSLVPQILKIPMYIAIGTGLFLSSFGYYKKFIVINNSD
jgi:multisubunit Na+/H+ antiporter MnhE subunit